jgi:hypothetical protein
VGELRIACVCLGGANPTGHAVCGERVVIPAHVRCVRARACEPAGLTPADYAETALAIREDAFILAEFTFNAALRAGRRNREPEGASAEGVGARTGFSGFGSRPQAGCTASKD